MKRNCVSATAIGLCTGVLLANELSATDWPQWGGNDPGRNMYSPAKGIPSQFDPGKPKKGTEDIDLSTTKNVKWVAKLGSETYGNPVIANGKLYIRDLSMLWCYDVKAE